MKPPNQSAGDAAAVEDLMLKLGDARKPVQRRAIDHLVALAASGNLLVAEKLRDSITSADRRVRWACAYALGQIGAGAFALDCADALCEAIGAEDGDIRWAAAELIVRLGREHPSEIGRRLLKLAADPASSRDTRKMALYCIRDLELGGPDLLALVERAARDPDPQVRMAALAAASRLGDAPEAAVRIVLARLESDPDPGVRRAAAAALGNMRAATAVAMTALASAAADGSDQSLNRAARGALDRLNKRR